MRRSRAASAGLILAASLSAASVGLAGAASAAPAAPRLQPATVSQTWTAAQHAARFALVKPTRTEGLPRNGGIRVANCVAPVADRLVTATYRRGAARPLGRTITVEQANASSRVPCPNVSGRGSGKVIARVRVDGETATLTRPIVVVVCGRGAGTTKWTKLSKCSVPSILQLRWARHGHDYQVTGVQVSRGQLISFARGLVPVR